MPNPQGYLRGFVATARGWRILRRTYEGGDGRAGSALYNDWVGRTPKTGGRELNGRTWDDMPTAHAARPLIAAQSPPTSATAPLDRRATPTVHPGSRR